MQHTINNAAIRNEFIKLLSNLSQSIRANREATQAVRQYIAKHKLTREQAEPYVMRHCANLYGVVLFVDAMQFKKPATTDKRAMQDWEAARYMKRALLKDLPSATPKARVVHKTDKVEQLVKQFRTMTKAEQRRFMESI